MKKWLLFIFVCLLVLHYYVLPKLDQYILDENPEAQKYTDQGEEKASAWENVLTYIKSFFEDEEEKYIYK